MTQPIGIELVRRGLITQQDIEKAIEYQRVHRNKKLGEILHILNICDETMLIEAIGEILGEKGIILTQNDINIRMEDYISIDVLRQNKAIPFDIENGRIKVCFADTTNKRTVDVIRLLLINKGLIMDKYITFEDNIDKILLAFDGRATDKIEISGNITGLIDSIIKTAIERRASDIHFEPLEDSMRIRFRIDGELYTITNIEKEKQSQIIGRLKAISNMHQEKQESQDGRILLYPDYNIRVSSQKNVYGEKFVLRLLKKNANVKSLYDLGFPRDEELVKQSFNKKNSITIMAAPTGEGKTTTLYGVVNYLNKPQINITTIEDPVEIRIPGLNQIEVDAKTNFVDSLRTVLRQDPDIILLGEIRDNQTAEIALQAGQTGHYVLSTIHTINSIEVITRLRKMGISNYDIASTLATSVSQRLVRKICPNCARPREFTMEEMNIIREIGRKYGQEYDFSGKTTFDAVGCEKCNNSGYYERIAIFEVLIIDDEIRELIAGDASTIKIKEQAMKTTYKPLVIDGINKVLRGITTLDELNRKLILF